MNKLVRCPHCKARDRNQYCSLCWCIRHVSKELAGAYLLLASDHPLNNNDIEKLHNEINNGVAK